MARQNVKREIVEHDTDSRVALRLGAQHVMSKRHFLIGPSLTKQPIGFKNPKPPANDMGRTFKNQRIRQFIADMMIESGEALTTGAIYDAQRGRRGAISMQQLCNYLSKDKQFVEVGSEYISTLYYSQKLWTHVRVLEQGDIQ